jgi:hypothetical protein
MYFRPLFRDRPAVVSREQNRSHDATVTEVNANGQTIEREEHMGGVPGRQFNVGGPSTSEGRPNPPSTSDGRPNARLQHGIQPTVQSFQTIRPIPPIQPIQPIPPIQPMPAMGAGHGFSFGDLHTMNLPGAPRLPQNPYADAAWWRQMYGPK